MRTALIHAIVVLMSALLVACSTTPKVLFPPDPNAPFKSIYLVSHGWHAGIVVNRADIPMGIWPQHNDFPKSEYLEVGWGDRDYYMTLDPHPGITLKAGLLPTASVLHIAGFNGAVTRYFPHSEVIRIDISADGFKRLCAYFENSYAKNNGGDSQFLGPGLYRNSRFYLSRETYHAFNTCNVWTARALHDVGCPITPALTLTVDTLMDRASKFGRVIQSGPATPSLRTDEPVSVAE